MRQLTASEVSYISGGDSSDELVEIFIEVLGEIIFQIGVEVFVRGLENMYNYYYPQTLVNSVFVPRRG